MTARSIVGPNDEPVAPTHACDCCGARYHGRGAALACCSRVLPDGGEVEDVEKTVTETVDEDDRTRTRTREVVETNVETVEEQEFRCPVCEQWFAEAEMVSVGLGVGDNDEMVGHRAYHDEDQLCGGCAESLFGYDGPSGLFDYAAAEWQSIDYRDILTVAVSISLGVGAAGLLLHGFGKGLESINRLSADGAVETAVLGPFADLAGVLGFAFVMLMLFGVVPRMLQIIGKGRI